MPYPGSFHRLVLIGTQYDNETWNTSLSIVPTALGELGMAAVSAQTLADVAAIVGTWFPLLNAGPGPTFVATTKLTHVKLNRINSAGHYQDEPSRTHAYATPIAGGGQTSIPRPPQLTIVHTLATALRSGKASKGRMYFPLQGHLDGMETDAQLTVAGADSTAKGLVDLIQKLNAYYTLIGRVGVASPGGTGRFEHVTRVRVGRVVDTMRSRRTSIPEQPVEWPV